jgi:hypothetical protein
MCIKKLNHLEMNQNGTIKKKIPKRLLSSVATADRNYLAQTRINILKNKNHAKKRPITVTELIGDLVMVKEEPIDVDEETSSEPIGDNKVRLGTRAFVSIMLHALKCRYKSCLF